MALSLNKGKSRGEKRCGHYRAAKAAIIPVMHGSLSLLSKGREQSEISTRNRAIKISRLDLHKWLMLLVVVYSYKISCIAVTRYGQDNTPVQ
jgi:hypothetical protein